jgi:hypothetical protein
MPSTGWKGSSRWEKSVRWNPNQPREKSVETVLKGSQPTAMRCEEEEKKKRDTWIVPGSIQEKESTHAEWGRETMELKNDDETVN